MRTETKCEPMEHTQLAAMFGRTPPPVIKVVLVHDQGSHRAHVFVINEGRGIARALSVRLTIAYKGRWRTFPDAKTSFIQQWRAEGSWQGRHHRGGAGRRKYWLRSTQPPEILLYPDDLAGVGNFIMPGDSSEVLVHARVDAIGMQPVRFCGHADLGQDGLVFVDEQDIDRVAPGWRELDLRYVTS